MKVELLRLGAANKPSPIPEGVAEIRISSQPYKGINLTTRHTQARRAPRVATIHDEVKEVIRAHLTLVQVFHAHGSVDIPWVAHAVSHFTSIRYGRIASVSVAHDATQFGDSICPVCVSTFKCLFIQTKPTRALIDTGGGLPPWSSEYQIRPLPFLPIQYSPFSPNCPARSHFKLFYHLF
jgi:hypothetical protein